MRNIQYLTIDINKKTQQDVTANEGEIGSRFLKIKITDSNVNVDLTGTKVYLYALKSDNTKLFNLVEIVDATQGVVLGELTSQLLTSPGVVKLTLVLTEGTKKLISKEFSLKVDDSIFDDDAIESTNEFTALTRSLNKVDEWNGYFEETSGQIEQKYTERLNGHDAQFISIESKTDYKIDKLNISAYNNSQIRPLVTFVSDDGHKDDLKMFDLFKSKGVKACTAVISGYVGAGNYMNANELKQLHDAGWDIMLHDTQHRHMNTLSEEELNNAMKTGKQTIENLGIPCRGLATPYGDTNTLVKRVSEKYFDYCFGANVGKINSLPIASYDLQRINHGGEGQTLQHYKNGVTRAIQENGLCVFCTHYYQLTEEQRVEMGELIDWIKEQGVDIVTVSEALEIFGNVQEYRNYDTDEYFCVTKSGKTLTSENGVTIIKPIESVTNATSITDFEFNKITVMNFTNGTTLGFPVNVGVLETYRDSYTDFNTFCYQKIIPVFSSDNNIRYRQWDNVNKKWQRWFKINIDLVERVVIDEVNGKTSSTPISDFANGKITYTTISGANVAGFPNEKSGILETNKIHGVDNGFQFQKYYESNLTRVWYRGTTSSGGWSAWRKEGVFTNLLRASAITSVSANSTVDIVLSTPGITTTDSSITVIPDVALPTGIIYSIMPHSTSGNIIVRLANLTSSAVSVPVMNWIINYTI